MVQRSRGLFCIPDVTTEKVYLTLLCQKEGQPVFKYKGYFEKNIYIYDNCLCGHSWTRLFIVVILMKSRRTFMMNLCRSAKYSQGFTFSLPLYSYEAYSVFYSKCRNCWWHCWWCFSDSYPTTLHVASELHTIYGHVRNVWPEVFSSLFKLLSPQLKPE